MTEALSLLAGDQLAAAHRAAEEAKVVSIATTLASHGHAAAAADVVLAAGNSAPPELLQRLASTLARAGDAERAEQLLRLAHSSDPEAAALPLAAALTRSGRAEEAAELLAAEAASRPSAAVLTRLGDIRAGLGEIELARASYMQSAVADASVRQCMLLATRLRRLPPIGRPVRIALLGNATLDQLAAALEVRAAAAGFAATVYVGAFDQYRQEIAGEQLWAFAPDVIVLAVHASRLFPLVHSCPPGTTPEVLAPAIEQGVGGVRALIRAIRERSPALILMHNLVVPQHPALGLADWRQPMSQAAAFSEANRQLAALARDEFRGVHIVDEDRVQASVGKRAATDPRLWFTGRIPWSDAGTMALAREHVRHLLAHLGGGRKCVVLDLDGTLWGGVVGEDGVEGVQIGADAPGNAFVAFQEELLRLWRRGILLAVCSKNDEDLVRDVFARRPEMVLRPEHIAVWSVSWDSKADGLRRIATALNLGVDSLVFLDDNPVERAVVRAALPEVLVPDLPADPAHYRGLLLDLPGLDASEITQEDLKRGQMYAAAAARDAARDSSQSLVEHLAGLNITVRIEEASSATLPRIAQLIGKTNQFNLTTRRYSQTEVEARLAAGWRVYAAWVADRFGDSGLTAVALVDATVSATHRVDNLLLSCRVMGRGVELALLRRLAEDAVAAGAESLSGEYVPSARNGPARGCYETAGFVLTGQTAGGASTWRLDLASLPAVPGWLTVIPDRRLAATASKEGT